MIGLRWAAYSVGSL